MGVGRRAGDGLGWLVVGKGKVRPSQGREGEGHSARPAQQAMAPARKKRRRVAAGQPSTTTDHPCSPSILRF